MTAAHVPKKEPFYIERRSTLEKLMFGTGRVRRFTQDSPVLPDVWLEYAIDPKLENERLTVRASGTEDHPPVHLLLTPFREVSTGIVRKEVRARLEREWASEHTWRRHDHKPRVIYNQSTVAATVHFEDLVRVLIPMTDWWGRLVKRFPIEHLDDDGVQVKLAAAVRDPEHPPLFTGTDGKERLMPPDVLWLIRVVGAIALLHRGIPLPEVFTDEKRGPGQAKDEDWLPLVEAVADLLRGVAPQNPDARIHMIALNRVCTPSISGSRLAVKADAAARVFDISCKDLRWAVMDSGIDARHPAFRKRDKEGVAQKATEEGENAFDGFLTRVRETYDFSKIHLLLDPNDPLTPDTVDDNDPETREQLENLNDALSAGRSVDWSLVAPLLRIRHDAAYKAPGSGSDHGTHVAGILGGNWPKNDSADMLEEDLVGVCPDIELYDLRILDDAGNGDEFTVMAALQFIRWLNSTNDYMAVHGVNMSLSIPHDVANYACGRTPVCDEAERVVSSGVVVVVAAGNQGYRKYALAEGGSSDAYNTISITDPGNAEAVITVGATHRVRPHTYGVSYFSSRGPTGDGRSKPDLVAPGEKITSPLPGALSGVKDGTSMAAPHVSGAAAMLMARHNELVGRPQRVKEILCRTATDLGRERYFQGSGMLDILRAVQSV